MTITQQMVDAIPPKWWLCTQDVQDENNDGQWCLADQMFYCPNEFEIFHYKDDKLHKHPAGFYCGDCLLEDGGKADKIYLDYILPRLYKYTHLISKLPQFIYPCDGTCKDDAEFGYEDKAIYWCETEFGEPGYYCYECISDVMWDIHRNDHDAHDEWLDRIGRAPYYEVKHVVRYKG